MGTYGKPKHGWAEKMATIAVCSVVGLCLLALIGEIGGWL